MAIAYFQTVGTKFCIAQVIEEKAMNKSIGGTVVRFVVGLAVANFVLFGTSAVSAQQKEGDVKQQLVGSWKILSYRSQNVGQDNWREPLGANPIGYAVFTADGRYMHLITTYGRKPATNDAERAALLNSMNAWSGRYAVEKDQLIMMVDVSASEGYQGDRQKQTRFFKLDGGKMTMRTPPQIGGRDIASAVMAVTEIAWEREK
jgi:hypothetical protein